MSRTLTIHRIGPAVTIQDMGRLGYIGEGVSRGGAADRLALSEGAALLGQPDTLPALEMMGMGGEFEASEDMRIALTGAEMRATIDGSPVVWNASHLLPAGSRLSIGPAITGCYGYLHLAGGISGAAELGSVAAHLAAGLGRALQAGDTLRVNPDSGGETGHFLERDDRLTGADIRMVASYQTPLFAENEIARFQSEALIKDARANRMGVRLNPSTTGFAAEDGRNIVSNSIMPGDIQITGDGTPFVLMTECQTTGGYPRIGTVLPCDLARVAQAAPGTPLRFRFVSLEEAVEIEQAQAGFRASLRQRLRPLIRDPHKIPNLLSYQLISGVIAGNEEYV